MALSYRNVGIGDANARLRVTPDGMVSLLTTYADTGTGAHTILCQMIAEVLDIPFNQVRLEVGTTDWFHSESGTGASRVTFVLGQAVLNAVDKLKALLRERAAEMLGVSSCGDCHAKRAGSCERMAARSRYRWRKLPPLRQPKASASKWKATSRRPKHRRKECSPPAWPKSMSTSRPVKSICASWTRFMMSRRF